MRRNVIAAVLVTLTAFSPMLHARKKVQPKSAEPGAPRSIPIQMTGSERVLHALDRLTFGPRPGDVEAISPKTRR